MRAGEPTQRAACAQARVARPGTGEQARRGAPVRAGVAPPGASEPVRCGSFVRAGPALLVALLWLAGSAACSEPLSLSDRGCATDGDCVDGNRCDLALAGGRCRPPCDGGCASGEGCDRGFCVPGFTEGCNGCSASGYECRADACVPSSTPIALVSPADTTAAPGSRLVLDGSGSSSPVGEPLRFRWAQLQPTGQPSLLGEGAASERLAVELPAGASGPYVLALTVTGASTGLSATAEARLAVITGDTLLVTIAATHGDGTTIGADAPAVGGERVLLVAGASGGPGARILSLETAEPGWVDEDPDPARFAGPVPGGCLIPPLFTATAVDDTGATGASQLLLPVTSPLPSFVVEGVAVSPAPEGTATVTVTGSVRDAGGLPAPALLAASRLFVEGGRSEVELQPGDAGSFVGVVELPCAQAREGATAPGVLRVELDPGCGLPVVQREPLELPRFPLVEGTVGIASATPTGTAGAPFRNLTRAIAAAGAAGCPLVALASGDHDPALGLGAAASLVVSRPVVLHGGHDPAAGWRPGGPATVLLARAGSVSLRAAGVGLSELTLDGDCGSTALLRVEQRSFLERVSVSRSGRVCLRQQQLVELLDSVQLDASDGSFETGAAPDSTGLLLGTGSELSMLGCDLTGGGPRFEGLRLLDGSSARLEGSTLAFSGTLGDATGIHALRGSSLTLVKSLVAADASGSVIAVWVDGATATITDSALHGGSGDSTIGLLAGSTSQVELFGGVARGGVGGSFAIGVLVDGARLTIRRGDESPDAGSRAPAPFGVTTPTPLLSGGQAPGAVSVGLAECAALSGCTAAGLRRGEIDVRRAFIAGVDYGDGVLAQTGVAAAVALASGGALIEDSVLLAQATSEGGVGQGAAVVSAAGDGPGDLLVHDALFGPFAGTTSASALVTTSGHAGSNRLSVLGCLLAAGSASSGGAVAIRRDEAAAGPERVEASLFEQGGATDLLLLDLGTNLATADVTELNTLLSTRQPNGIGGLRYSYPPLRVGGCDGCANAGWRGSEEDGLDFYGAARLGEPDVGPFEFQ